MGGGAIKRSSGTNAVGSNRTEYYSNVDTKTTWMSEEDKERVGFGSWGTRYFQTANSFRVNDALRNATENGTTIEEALQDSFGSRWGDQMKLVEAMDRNMRPLDKDISVVRMADGSYLNAIISNAGLPRDVQDRLIRAANGSGMFRESDVAVLNDKLAGVKITESAFMSTTYNKSLSDSAFSSRGVKIEMDVKKGTKAMFSPTGEESEMVLNRGTSYTAGKFSVKNGKLIISAHT